MGLARRFHSSRAPLRHCMQANTPLQVAIFSLVFLVCAKRAQSFALYLSKTTQTHHGKGAYTYTKTASSAPRLASTYYPRLAFTGISPVGRAPSSLCAAADATTFMASEADMPVLRVLSVDEVPTVKADPVDPIAREQAKVRSRSCVARARGICSRRHQLQQEEHAYACSRNSFGIRRPLRVALPPPKLLVSR